MCSDSASNNIAMMDNFRIHCREELNIAHSIYHTRCFLHILNLAAQELLSNITTAHFADEDEDDFLIAVEGDSVVKVVY